MRKEFQEKAVASWVAPRCIERSRSRNRLAKGFAPTRRAYRKATNSPESLECLRARAQRLAIQMFGSTPVVVKIEVRVPETFVPLGWWDSGWFEEWLKIAREGKG